MRVKLMGSFLVLLPNGTDELCALIGEISQAQVKRITNSMFILFFLCLQRNHKCQVPTIRELKYVGRI